MAAPVGPKKVHDLHPIWWTHSLGPDRVRRGHREHEIALAKTLAWKTALYREVWIAEISEEITDFLSHTVDCSELQH